MNHIIAEAHCDIPCGIYEPTVAKLAARTVARMVEQISELSIPTEPVSKVARDAYIQAVTRRIAIKEQHAEICKRELEILWSDFFKKEHLDKVPDLHNKIWTAVKLASKFKQEISKDLADELLKAVDIIAEAFYLVKGVPKRMKAYREITDKIY